MSHVVNLVLQWLEVRIGKTFNCQLRNKGSVTAGFSRELTPKSTTLQHTAITRDVEKSGDENVQAFQRFQSANKFRTK